MKGQVNDWVRGTMVMGERFAGLNFRGFYPMKFFTEKLSWYALNNTIMYIIIFMDVLLKTVKNAKANFPHLQCVVLKPEEYCIIAQEYDHTI